MTLFAEKGSTEKREADLLELTVKFRDIWLSKLRALKGLNKRTNLYKEVKGQMNAFNESFIILTTFCCEQFGWNGCEFDLKLEEFEKKREATA